MRRLASLCLVLAIAGCSTVGVDVTTPPPAAPAAPTNPTGLDYLRDDVANLTFAIDLPQGVFAASGSNVLFDVKVADPTVARHVQARLVRADADGVASSLPALAAGHIYYFFTVADADKAAVREAQQDAVSHAVPPANVAVTLAPVFCAPRVIDATQVVVSVRVVLPGKHGLGPFIDRQTMAQVLARSGATTMVPVCAR